MLSIQTPHLWIAATLPVHAAVLQRFFAWSRLPIPLKHHFHCLDLQPSLHHYSTLTRRVNRCCLMLSKNRCSSATSDLSISPVKFLPGPRAASSNTIYTCAPVLCINSDSLFDIQWVCFSSHRPFFVSPLAQLAPVALSFQNTTFIARCSPLRFSSLRWRSSRSLPLVCLTT